MRHTENLLFDNYNLKLVAVHVCPPNEIALGSTVLTEAKAESLVPSVNKISAHRVRLI